MKHSELIEYAARWLRTAHPVIITEMASQQEEADAIGFCGHATALIECKATHEDFLSDKRKSFRRDPKRGMGNLRFYLCPKGVIQPEELPEKWGLLWIRGTRVYRERMAMRQESNHRAETRLLMSVIRRMSFAVGDLGKIGASAKFYTYETNNRATVGIEREPAPSR